MRDIWASVTQGFLNLDSKPLVIAISGFLSLKLRNDGGQNDALGNSVAQTPKDWLIRRLVVHASKEGLRPRHKVSPNSHAYQ